MNRPDMAAAKDAITIDFTIGPLDRAKREADQKWGFDRLPEIVSPATAQKFGRAMEAYEQELLREEPDPARVKAFVDNLVRAYAALDREAESLGRESFSTNTIHLQVNGEPAIIVADRAFMAEAKRLWPRAALYTPDELERLLSERGMDLVNEAKRVFRDAEVTEVRALTQLEKELGDEIPF